MTDLQILDAKIEIARNHLKEYYSASVGPQTQKKFALTFLDVDRASVHWVDGLWRIEHKPVSAPVGRYVGIRVRSSLGAVVATLTEAVNMS